MSAFGRALPVPLEEHWSPRTDGLLVAACRLDRATNAAGHGIRNDASVQPPALCTLIVRIQRSWLSKHFVVVSTPEAYTSKTCSLCGLCCGSCDEVDAFHRAKKSAAANDEKERARGSFFGSVVCAVAKTSVAQLTSIVITTPRSTSSGVARPCSQPPLRRRWTRRTSSLKR